MHKHQIFVRQKDKNGNLVQSLAVERITEFASPDEGLVRQADVMARQMANERTRADAVLYKVDGKLEHFSSKYYYLWPNVDERYMLSRERDKRRKKTVAQA